MFTTARAALLPLGLLACLAACNPGAQPALDTVSAEVISFEAKAAPAVAKGCARFRQAEANPLVQLGVAAGSIAASAATGGAAGPVIASVKSFGDQFCAYGPPAGDTTSPAQQAMWIAGVAGELLKAAGAK